MAKDQSTHAIDDAEYDQLQETVGVDDFSAAPPRKVQNFWPSFKRMVGLLMVHRLSVAIVLVTGIIGVVLNVYAPRVLGRAVDVLFGGAIGASMPADTTRETAIEGARAAGQDSLADMLTTVDFTPGTGIDFPLLSRLLISVLVLYLFSSFFLWLQGAVLNKMTMATVYGLRKDVEKKINNLPLSYFDTRQRGDVLSRTTNDLDNVQQALQQAVAQIVFSLLMIIGITAMMFSISWQLTLIALLALPLSAVIIGTIGSKAQKSYTSQWKATGSVNGQVEETFSGAEVVRIFGNTESMRKTFDERNEDFRDAATKAQFLSGAMLPLMMFVNYLSYVGIAVVGGLRVASGSMSIGAVVAFVQYSREFNQPLSEIAGLMTQMQSGIASAERVFELLDAEEQEPETASPLRAEENPTSRGLVEFKDVDFSYSPEHPLIEDLNLTVRPGQTAAIVGPTGAGKTTMVNLIMRFYEIDGGEILLDGVNIRDMTRHDLRSHVGMVLQDAVLFEGTIMDNIRYGRLDATDEEVIESAKATYVDRFVHALPEGYDTVISGDSGSVSAGERQLITIARAFLSKPALLILDEATSSVDTRTEVLVQEAMSTLRAQRTSFVIAHRLSTIRDADVILVMEDGSIVEQGNHAQLMAREGAYFDLYTSQFKGESEEAANPEAEED